MKKRPPHEEESQRKDEKQGGSGVCVDGGGFHYPLDTFNIHSYFKNVMLLLNEKSCMLLHKRRVGIHTGIKVGKFVHSYKSTYKCECGKQKPGVACSSQECDTVEGERKTRLPAHYSCFRTRRIFHRISCPRSTASILRALLVNQVSSGKVNHFSLRKKMSSQYVQYT